MEWIPIDITPEVELDIILVSKDGHIFSGYLNDIKNNNYKIVTMYELQDDGFYKPLYSTINKSYFSFYMSFE